MKDKITGFLCGLSITSELQIYPFGYLWLDVFYDVIPVFLDVIAASIIALSLRLILSANEMWT